MHFALHAVKDPAAQRETGHRVTHFKDRPAGNHRVLLGFVFLLALFGLREQRKTARKITAIHGAQTRDRRQQRF